MLGFDIMIYLCFQLRNTGLRFYGMPRWNLRPRTTMQLQLEWLFQPACFGIILSMYLGFFAN